MLLELLVSLHWWYIDGFHAMGTGGHYITMQPADWSISKTYDPLPSSCHSEKMLWNPSIALMRLKQTNVVVLMQMLSGKYPLDYLHFHSVFNYVSVL